MFHSDAEKNKHGVLKLFYIMNKQRFNWSFGTIATLIIVAAVLGIIASKGYVTSALFSLAGGLGGLAALGLSRKAFYDFQKSEEALGVTQATIRQLEKRLVAASPLHRLLAELPKLHIAITMEDGNGVSDANFENLQIQYGDLKNVLIGQISAYHIYQLKFEVVNDTIKVYTNYNQRGKNFASCDKPVDGDILTILENGEGSLTFLTGGELDENRKEVLIRLSKEPAA